VGYGGFGSSNGISVSLSLPNTYIYGNYQISKPVRAGADKWVMQVAGSAKRRRAAPFALAIVFAGRQLHAQIIFLRPPGEGDSSAHTDLWCAGCELPGTAVVSESSGLLL
jgi:hypothetical protein